MTAPAGLVTVFVQKLRLAVKQVSLGSDNVFGEDGGAQQLGTVTGSVEAGYVVELAVPVLSA